MTLQLRADVRILLDGWSERIDGRPVHHAGLVSQLRDQVVDAGGTRDENRSGKATGPKLPGDENALSLLVELERDVAGLACWIAPNRVGQHIEENLRFLDAEAVRMIEPVYDLIASGIGQVRDRIEVFLQWLDGGSHTYYRCPRCEHREIWLYASDPGREVAICRHCHTRWDGEPGLRALSSELTG